MNILSLGGQALKLGTALLQMGGGGGGGSGTSTLGTVPGTLHWFDATVPSAVLSPSGTPLTQWAGASVGSLKNQIAGGAAMSSVGVGGSYTVSPPALAGGARARVNKGFAACGPAELASGRPYTLWPTLDNNHKWALPGVNLSAASAWWIAIAYTRPNMQQIQSSQTASSGTLSYLLAFNVLGLLAIDNITRSTVAGADIGTLSVLGTSVRTNAAPRHYSTVLLQNVPGTGISVYLDGNATAAATGISAASLGTTTQILYAMGVPGSYSSTSAQCYLHEFALGGALTAPQRAAVLASLGRYPVGVADVALFSDAGQSNLGFVPASAFDAMRRLVAYFGGFVAVDFFANEGQAPGRAMGYSNTSYLADPGDGSDPSTWAYGSVGANNQSARNNAVVHLPYDQAGFAAIFTYYSEADSGQDYSYKTRMKAI